MIVPLPFFGGFLYRQLLMTPPEPKMRFDGKTIIITGANIGLGFEAARYMGRLGAARIILAVRDVDKGEVAKRALDSAVGVSPSPYSVWQLDMASYDSVRDFAARAGRELERVDVVCQNAGIATGTFALAEKDERSVTVNVVCAFLLTFLMLPKLKETARRFNTHPVVTFSASEIHQFYDFAQRNEPNIFAALSDPSKANMAERYYASKLLQLLCAREMASRAGPDYPVAINSFNPGFVQTQLGREAGWQLWLWGVFLARSPRVGSRTLVAAAGAGPESHGRYMSECAYVEPGAFVRSDEGRRVQTKVWDELVAKLEEIEPGVTANL